MTEGRILVVGGYGAVGRVAATALAQWFPGRVAIAGRDLQKAQTVAKAAPHPLSPLQLDLESESDFGRILQGISLVVMCVERNNLRLAQACLERGIHFVDISASMEVLTPLAELHGLGVEQGATGVLSVGLAPGLTNLLARHVRDQLSQACRVEITILGGLGEVHGSEAVRWTVEKMAERMGAQQASRPKRIPLPGFGMRTAHPFPFSDQFTLTKSLGIPVSTRLCFDSPFATWLLFGLRAIGFFAFLRRWRAEWLVTWVFTRFHFGTDQFVVRASAFDDRGTELPLAVTGRREAWATGMVTALVARRLLQGGLPSGVSHLEQLVQPEGVFDELQRQGIDFHR